MEAPRLDGGKSRLHPSRCSSLLEQSPRSASPSFPSSRHRIVIGQIHSQKEEEEETMARGREIFLPNFKDRNINSIVSVKTTPHPSTDIEMRRDRSTQSNDRATHSIIIININNNNNNSEEIFRLIEWHLLLLRHSSGRKKKEKVEKKKEK
jgi:hypothetical protein